MSLSESNEETKIAPVDSLEVKRDASMPKTKQRPNHDPQENHGAVPKITQNVNPNEEANNDLANKIEGLVLSPDSSDDAICKPDWLRARDSLENLLFTKSDKAGVDHEVINSKSTSCATSSKDKYSIGESPHSESLIGTKSSCSGSVAKVLSWDPWDKLGRKNKKENKSLQKRKHDKHIEQKTQDQRKDFKAGDEAATHSENAMATESDEYMENYEYQPYQPKNSRSVEFTNKVMVVYIKEDKVIGEATEPLKKELDQQIRNKEMRKGHMLDIPVVGKRRMDWFK